MKKFIYIVTFIFIFTFLSKNKKLNNPRYVFELLEQRGIDRNLLKRAEQIYILETGNFTSNIYKNTYGAGAIAAKQEPPYGFIAAKYIKPTGLYLSRNGNYYLKFSNLLHGVMFLLFYLKQGDVNERTAKWGGGNEYLKQVLKVKNKIIV